MSEIVVFFSVFLAWASMWSKISWREALVELLYVDHLVKYLIDKTSQTSCIITEKIGLLFNNNDYFQIEIWDYVEHSEENTVCNNKTELLF